jgi:hypothetical protein
MRPPIIVLALLGSVVLGPLPVAAQSSTFCPAGQSPHYAAGFADLKAHIGDAMGDPLTCEYPDPNGTGDIHQDTTTGLAFWRKSTNTPTFTDGFNHWGLTAQGWVTWTGSSVDPPTAAANVYPDVLVQSFMQACIGGDAGKRPVCQCAIDKIQAQYTLVEFINFAQRIEGGELPPELENIAIGCAISTLQSRSTPAPAP